MKDETLGWLVTSITVAAIALWAGVKVGSRDATTKCQNEGYLRVAEVKQELRRERFRADSLQALVDPAGFTLYVASRADSVAVASAKVVRIRVGRRP